jgi:hypothetical protein
MRRLADSLVLQALIIGTLSQCSKIVVRRTHENVIGYSRTGKKQALAAALLRPRQRLPR